MGERYFIGKGCIVETRPKGFRKFSMRRTNKPKRFYPDEIVKNTPDFVTFFDRRESVEVLVPWSSVRTEQKART